jgi:hypothetical protein
MRSTWLAAALSAAFAVAGCGSDDAQHGGGAQDMSVPDMTVRDMTTPTACSPTDPLNDGTSCAAPGGCPTGTIGVNLGGSCKCYTTCATNPECSCNRLCDPVTLNDAGAGAACLPGNDPGERCGRDTTTGAPFGNVFCGQLTVCINADPPPSQFRYCSYKCVKQADCPAQTSCTQYTDQFGNVGSVCAYNSGVNGNKDLGQACTSTDVCKLGQLCTGVCSQQCDGPGATCATGSCTRIDDPASGKIIGYACK